MKTKKIVLITVVVAITATAFKMAEDIITRLGMEQQTAQRYIINNLAGNFSYGPMEPYESNTGTDTYSQLKSFRLPYMPKLSIVLSGDKAAAAQEVCEYIKRYINSEEFIDNYKKARQEAMPLTQDGMSLSTLQANDIVFGKNINNYKTDTKYVAEQQQKREENQKRIDNLLEAAKKPFPGKEVWEKTYPVDPTALVKKRLQEYLQLAATVDFSAKLTEPDKYKVKRFVNPVYEKKSLKWKAIYRAGKEVNDVVTAFVKEWLKGEIIAKEKTKMTANTTNGQSQEQPSNSTVATSNNSNTSGQVSASPVETVKKQEQPAEKKSGIKKLKDKLGSVIKH